MVSIICAASLKSGYSSKGLSKWCGAVGWRLGTFTFPDSLVSLLEALAVMASETFTSTSAPIQYAAIRAFQGGSEIENYLWRSRWILDKLGSRISGMLNNDDIYTPKPDGAFYLFPDFSDLKDVMEKKGIKTSTELCNKLLEETGAALLPGEAFGRPAEELTARLAYVDFNGTKAISAAIQLHNSDELDDNFLDHYCGGMLKSINLICDWIKS